MNECVVPTSTQLTLHTYAPRNTPPPALAHLLPRHSCGHTHTCLTNPNHTCDTHSVQTDGCDRLLPERLAQVASHQNHLPHAFTNLLQTNCSARYAAALAQEYTTRLAAAPPCKGKKAAIPYSNDHAIGQHILSQAGMHWRTRAECRPGPPHPVDDEPWQWLRGASCAARGWDCLFLAPRVVSIGAPSAQGSADSVCAEVPPELTGALLETPVDSARSSRRLASQVLAEAVVTDVVSRPSVEVAEWARRRRRELRPERATRCAGAPRVSLQIRRGDKCAGQEQFACSGLRDYEAPLAAIRAAYGSCSILLATDSSSIIDELRAVESPPLAEYHVTYLEFDRSGHSSRACTPMPTCQWIEYRARNLGVDTSGMGFSLVADLDLLREGDVFVGQFDSAVGQLGWMKMAARTGILPPWHHFQEQSFKLNFHPLRRGFS